MKTVAIIPARGGSTRIPRKNIRDFRGKPIIAYSIAAARDSGLFDQVIVSTEDREIAEIAQAYNADVILRPAELADNETGTQEVMRHAMGVVQGADIGCCIYPTAPMMGQGDLYLGLCAINNGSIYAFTVGTEPALHDAGQFYWGKAWAFRGGAPLISMRTAMIPIDANRDCDINTEADWLRAEIMYDKLTGRA